MKRFICVCLAACFLLISLPGCSDIRSKFVRKPKKETELKRYIPVRTYDIHPSMDLYSKRYIFWKNWHKEFMDLIKDPRMTNQKKLMVSLEQEISNLYDMRAMLVDEKGDELGILIDKVREVQLELGQRTLTKGNKVRITSTMELLGKEIKDKFSYRKLTGEIRDEFREN